MTEIALPHVIYGRGIAADASSLNPHILAISDNLNPELIPTMAQGLPVYPLAVDGSEASQAVAWLQYTDQPQPQFLLARTHWRGGDQTSAVTQLIYIPTAALRHAGNDLQPLLDLVGKPLPDFQGTQRTIPALRLPVLNTTRLDQRTAVLETIIRNTPGENIDLLLGILGGAINGQVVIRNFVPDWHKRAELVSAVMILLPQIVRHHLTFTTHSPALEGDLPRIVFSEAPGESACEIDWNQPLLPASLFEHPYVALLRSRWEGTPKGLLELVRALDLVASRMLSGQPVWDGLAALALRFQHDHAAEIGQSLPVETLLTVLDSAVPPQGELRAQYLEQLLQHALTERNTQAAERTAQEMDADPEVEHALEPVLTHAIEFQPDAAYVFARARLSDGTSRKWLGRLRRAAQQALDVALESGDPKLIGSWLTLISREPLRYELVDVLRSGILAAREHVSEKPDLALELLTLAVKRQPDTLPVLLEAADLRAALPERVRLAIVDFDADAIEHLINDGRELFLLALSRAVEQGENCITPAAIQSLWEIHTQQQNNTLPPQYRPLAIIQNIAHDDKALQEGALVSLLALMLADSADTLFADVSAIIAGRGKLAAVMIEACANCGRSLDELLVLINNLISEGTLTPQEAIHTFSALLRDVAWDEAALPMVEQLARLLNQYPETTADGAILWHIAEISGELKSEQMMRVALRRLLIHIGEMQSEGQCIESLLRLRKAVLWSSTGRGAMIRWWRHHIRAQSLPQIQKLERALEGKRVLEEFHAVANTAQALRRVMGQRSLEEFARDIDVTYNLLQALSEGFDPEERGGSAVDSPTIRSELEARGEEIPADVRHVLAANLKQLAQIITTLAENRSKPSLIRSDDVVERQLVTGEQQPQSAIDVMRWLSGYFDGVQKEELEK